MPLESRTSSSSKAAVRTRSEEAFRAHGGNVEPLATAMRGSGHVTARLSPLVLVVLLARVAIPVATLLRVDAASLVMASVAVRRRPNTLDISALFARLSGEKLKIFEFDIGVKIVATEARNAI